MGEKPKFYCETCGREVPVDVDECPYCGMQFYGVMCPRCGKSGPAEIFTNGCPRCGYRSVTGRGGAANVPVTGIGTAGITGRGPAGTGPAITGPGPGYLRPDLEDTSPPKPKKSIWGPLLAILLLATIAAVIIFLLIK